MQLKAQENQIKVKNVCLHCHSDSFEENQQANMYCTNCGRVCQSAVFSNKVTFSNLKMEGQVIDTNEKDNRTTSEKRLKKAKAKIDQLKNLLKIQLDDDKAIDASNRIIRYADSLNFFDRGKNIQLYAAAALYITLRFVKAPYLLIDFSDKMNIYLFKLARCCLKLLRRLGFQHQLPLIDPSLYIHRYCKMLAMGDKTRAITMTAIKLVQQMKRDWMCQGRRPSSLCGAAILIASRIHDVKVSTNDICRIVSVCGETIRRRLEEFKQTSAAKLTKEQFEAMEDQFDEIGNQMDPPAFSKARLKSKQQMIRQRIREEIQARPMKQKMEKIPWNKYKETLNIPEELLVKQIKQVQKELLAVREKYEDDSFEQSERYSNMTDDDFFNDQEQQQQSENDKKQQMISEIDDQEINRFILDQQDRTTKKNLWMKHNGAWLQKEKIKKLNQVKLLKKVPRNKKHIQQGSNAYESIKNTKIGEKIDDDNLKQLLGSEPVQEKQSQLLQLSKFFNPFLYPWNENK